MREIRQSGSEGGGTSLRSPYPYRVCFQGGTHNSRGGASNFFQSTVCEPEYGQSSGRAQSLLRTGFIQM